MARHHGLLLRSVFSLRPNRRPLSIRARSLRTFLGIQVAWLVWFVRLTSCAANTNLFVIYLGEFWPHAGQPAAKVAILTLLLGILAAINFFGVRAGTRVSNSFTVAKLASLLLVIVAGAVYLVGMHRIIPAATVIPAPHAWPRAIVLLIFAYGGFEAALISAGEAKDPRRDAPFGLFAALITCAIIYCFDPVGSRRHPS